MIRVSNGKLISSVLSMICIHTPCSNSIDVHLRPRKKNSCVQVSLPTLIFGPTLKMVTFFLRNFLYRNDLQYTSNGSKL